MFVEVSAQGSWIHVEWHMAEEPGWGEHLMTCSRKQSVKGGAQGGEKLSRPHRRACLPTSPHLPGAASYKSPVIQPVSQSSALQGDIAIETITKGGGLNPLQCQIQSDGFIQCSFIRLNYYMLKIHDNFKVIRSDDWTWEENSYYLRNFKKKEKK